MIPLLVSAMAQDLVSYDANNIVEHGTTPTVTFTVNESGTFGFGVNCGVRRWRLPAKAYSSGERVVMELAGVPEGDHSCAGAIEVQMADGREGTLPFQIPVRSLKPLSWVVKDEDYDAAGRTLTVTASRPLASAEAELIGAEGKVLQKIWANLEDPTRPVLSWNTREEVLKIEVKGKDTLGATSTLTLSPWQYAIPHEDVVFATGDATITDAEAPKLETTWADIEKTLAKYGDVVKIQLFVAGYTDTVGDKGSNLALSRRRARSIATWFRERGFTGPISYQGFGESVLAVGTADEVDQAENRRALYVLSAGAPRRSDAIPRSEWTSL